jgi:hemolysin activation/secretion protein
VPDTRFTAVQGNLSYSQGLPAGFSMALSLCGQWADTTVPQNQQWVIGGFGNLTAWLPAILVGDMGSLGRLSISAPAQSWAGYSLSGTAFVESGIVRLSYTPPNNPVTRTLADAGLSLTGSTPFGTNATLAFAWPIASRNVDLDAINAQGRANLYFSLSQTF